MGNRDYRFYKEGVGTDDGAGIGRYGGRERVDKAGRGKEQKFHPPGRQDGPGVYFGGPGTGREISGIIVVGPVEDLKALQKEYSFEIVPEEGSIVNNIYAPYNRGLLEGPFLLVTGDIPLITKESMEDFLKQCSPYDLDFYYPIISKEAIDGPLPHHKRGPMCL
jgi:hypothetical protein